MTRQTLRLYFTLTKPGVLFGNALSAAAGYFLAAAGLVDIPQFLYLITGTTLIIASACVLNNYFDRDIDSVMERTKKRAVAAGKIPGRNAVIFGLTLGILGFTILFLRTNIYVVILGAIGFADYLVLYGMLGKRRSMHGTLIGSISGAIPILAGYVGARGAIDVEGIIAFAVIFFWQMPEFYSITIYRYSEYKKARVPVISVVKGIEYTKKQILLYTVLFCIATLLLYFFSPVGRVYLVVIGVLDAIWLGIALQGLQMENSDKWARKMFRFSLIILLSFCALISLTGVLPL